MADIKQEFLESIMNKVTGDRQDDYGDAVTCHERIAALWDIWDKNKQSKEFTAYDAAMMMVMVKIARCMHKPTRDNHEDMGGYAACLEHIRQSGENDGRET